MTYSPFDISRAIGNNLSQGFKESRDETLIEKVLAQTANDPEAMQGAIGTILSKVSPERQGPAIQYLQNAYQTLAKKKQLAEQEAADRKSAEEAGYTYGVPPAVAAAQVKEKEKQKRLAPLGLGFGAEQPAAVQNFGMAASGDMGSAVASVAGALPGVAAGSPITPTAQPVSQQAESIFRRLDDDQLIKLTGYPDKEVSEPAKAELKRRQEAAKEERADVREARKETAVLKQDLAQKAQLAAQSLLNKEQQLQIIDRKDINDPTFATLMENLPFQLGTRFLSNDTVQYKAALVDDYRDLKNIFVGQTRNAELDILSKKIADTYYTDEQKKAIIKARMGSLEMDVAKADIAAEIEEEFPNLGILQFTKKLNERVKEKTSVIANRVLDDLTNIQKEAETTKSRPLDVRNPNDAEIMKQILMEANGNVKKAYEIAEKKGYKVKK